MLPKHVLQLSNGKYSKRRRCIEKWSATYKFRSVNGKLYGMWPQWTQAIRVHLKEEEDVSPGELFSFRTNWTKEFNRPLDCKSIICMWMYLCAVCIVSLCVCVYLYLCGCVYMQWRLLYCMWLLLMSAACSVSELLINLSCLLTAWEKALEWHSSQFSLNILSHMRSVPGHLYSIASARCLCCVWPAVVVTNR